MKYPHYRFEKIIYWFVDKSNKKLLLVFGKFYWGKQRSWYYQYKVRYLWKASYSFSRESRIL